MGISIDALKTVWPENGRATIPLSAVSTIAFLYSSENPVAVRLSDPDGEVKPCGMLPPGCLDHHKLELRNYTGLIFEEQLPKNGKATLMLLADVRHKVGERISAERHQVHERSSPRLSEQERIRRAVMATLIATKTMPDDDTLEALEAELGFDLEADEWGDYLEDPPFDDVDDDHPSDPEPAPGPGPDPEPAPGPGPEPEPPGDPVQ